MKPSYQMVFVCNVAAPTTLYTYICNTIISCFMFGDETNGIETSPQAKAGHFTDACTTKKGLSPKKEAINFVCMYTSQQNNRLCNETAAVAVIGN